MYKDDRFTSNWNTYLWHHEREQKLQQPPGGTFRLLLARLRWQHWYDLDGGHGTGRTCKHREVIGQSSMIAWWPPTDGETRQAVYIIISKQGNKILQTVIGYNPLPVGVSGDIYIANYKCFVKKMSRNCTLTKHVIIISSILVNLSMSRHMPCLSSS